MQLSTANTVSQSRRMKNSSREKTMQYTVVACLLCARTDRTITYLFNPALEHIGRVPYCLLHQTRTQWTSWKSTKHHRVSLVFLDACAAGWIIIIIVALARHGGREVIMLVSDFFITAIGRDLYQVHCPPSAPFLCDFGLTCLSRH